MDMVRLQIAPTRLVSLSSVRGQVIIHTSRQSEASFSQPGGLGFSKRATAGVNFDPAEGSSLYALVQFGFAMALHGFSLVVPYWLLVLVFGILAAVIWYKQTWRFSLRTLLIATTVVAVALGLIVALR